jgi:hypothetical protein
MGEQETAREEARQAAAQARAMQRNENRPDPAAPVDGAARRRQLAEEVLDFLDGEDERTFAEHFECIVRMLAAVAPSSLSSWLADQRSCRDAAAKRHAEDQY